MARCLTAILVVSLLALAGCAHSSGGRPARHLRPYELSTLGKNNVIVEGAERFIESDFVTCLIYPIALVGRLMVNYPWGC